MFSLLKLLALPAMLSALAVSAAPSPSPAAAGFVHPPPFNPDTTVPLSSSPTVTRSQAVAAAIAAAPERANLQTGASDEEMVHTPGGLRPKSMVHSVPAGGHVLHVGNEIHLVDATGTVIHKAVNDNTIPRRPEATGWVDYASVYYSGSTPIQEFITTWTVPPVPASNVGQTIFLFNSIEPASFNAILQPVLQWGGSAAGGGAYWALASWYLVGSNTYYTGLTQVSPGASLQGVIDMTSYSGSSFNYQTWFSNYGGTVLTVTGAAQLVWVTETLEAYGVQATSSYPPGTTIFSSVYFWLVGNTYPSISWSTSADTADGLSIAVNSQGSYDAEFTISY